MTLYIGDKPVGLMKVVKDTKYIDKTKYGVSIDNLLGDVDENGTYYPPTELFTLDLSGVRTFYVSNVYIDGVLVFARGLKYRFYGVANLTGTIDLSSVEKAISSQGSLEAAFAYSGITEIILPQDHGNIITMLSLCEGCNALKRVVFTSTVIGGNINLQNGFQGCSNLEEVVGLENVTVIKGAGSLFNQCSKLKQANLSNVQEISGDVAMMFGNCSALTRIDFPSLTSVVSSAFGSSSFYAIFTNCNALTEIHFRADMQATIEAMSGYSSKWGAKNATIYFSL